MCKGTMEFSENIQGLNIWGLRWRRMTSGQLDSERPCDLVKGCYSLEESGELMRGSGEGGEQGWVGGGDGVGWVPLFFCHPRELGTTSGVVNWASEGAAPQAFCGYLQRLGNQNGATIDWPSELEGRGRGARSRTPGGAGPALPGTRTEDQGMQDVLKRVAICWPIGQRLLTPPLRLQGM